MLRTATASILVLLMMLTPGLVPQAEAGLGRWLFGAGFHIGDLHFKIGLHFRDHHRPHHYYRTHHHVRYDGYSCSRHCYRQDKYNYHHSSCPVVRHHAYRYGYDLDHLYDRYAPRYQSYDRYDRYDRGRYYDRGSRYDRDHYDGYDRRSHRYDRHDRYDRYDRYHDRRSCKRWGHKH